MRSLQKKEYVFGVEFSTPTFLTTRVVAANSGFARFSYERVFYRQADGYALRNGNFASAFFDNALHFGHAYAFHRGTP